ncbi:MAG TPA: hypothetical protein VH855_09850 [Acetobacteraceae bacterium]|jgi:hypothetical protein
MQPQSLERLPTKEEFDRIAADFAQQVVQLLMPAMIRNAIVEIQQSDRVPYHLRQLLESQRLSEKLAKKSASPRK